MNPSSIDIAVVGAGPVGLALALLAARSLPAATVTLFDARDASKDVSGDPRTLALSLGSVQLLQRLQAWDAAHAQPITEVHVSQQPPSIALPFGPPEVRLRAADLKVAMLGAVQSYGAVVAPLQRVWEAEVSIDPQRLRSRFGAAVSDLKAVEAGVEIDAGIAERFDLAVVAEGGVFMPQPDQKTRTLISAGRAGLQHDYHQTAWVGSVVLEGGRPGAAYERFTRHGPAALLPLGLLDDGTLRAGLVWCVPSDDDPVRELNDAQRIAVLNTIFHPETGRVVQVSPLKHFALGLSAQRTLVQGRAVRIGNAAQTLHPVAGQGLNLGLRDAYALVQALRDKPDVDAALRRVEWQRAPDRWSMIAATDFLARSFTWQAPGLATARGLGLALLQAMPPVKALLARQMMFGRR
jgi:2-octaprenyl-6-methoxyphenol hydroxylase